MPPDKDVDEDSRDQTECAVLIETDKTKPDALKPVFSTDSLASSNLINVPSKSELAVYNDVSCSESELEVRSTYRGSGLGARLTGLADCRVNVTSGSRSTCSMKLQTAILMLRL
jgi:hypothetical protein